MTATDSVKRYFSIEPVRIAAAPSPLPREKLNSIRIRGMNCPNDAKTAGIKERDKEGPALSGNRLVILPMMLTVSASRNLRVS